MTYREAAVITVYTGVCLLEGNDFEHVYKYAEEILGRPVHTLDFVINRNLLKEKSKPDFIKICKNLTR